MREWGEVGWEEPDAGDTAFDDFASAMKNGWLMGLDPFVNLAGWKSDELGDGC
jgi:hypothetical protein